MIKLSKFIAVVSLLAVSALSLTAAPNDVPSFGTYIPKSSIPLLRTSLADTFPLTDAATTKLDPSKGGPLFTWTIAGNRTNDIVGHRAGRRFWLEIKQDATGSRLITWDTDVVWAGGSAPTLTTTASKKDLVEFVDNGVKYVGKVFAQNY